MMLAGPAQYRGNNAYTIVKTSRAGVEFGEFKKLLVTWSRKRTAGGP